PLRHEFAAEASTVAGEPVGLMCWPEHLHVGLLIGAEPDSAAATKALRVGLSAGDDRYAEPYFFVAAQYGGEIEKPHPGAVLTASRIIAEGFDADGVRGILRNAVATTRRRLAN
ncbi:MAG: hypothetical protein ABL908_16435, partial [Hyphomicrobium sp.]